MTGDQAAPTAGRAEGLDLTVAPAGHCRAPPLAARHFAPPIPPSQTARTGDHLNRIAPFAAGTV